MHSINDLPSKEQHFSTTKCYQKNKATESLVCLVLLARALSKGYTISGHLHFVGCDYIQHLSSLSIVCIIYSIIGVSIGVNVMFFMSQFAVLFGHSNMDSVALIDRGESMPRPPRQHSQFWPPGAMVVASSGFEHARCYTTCQFV